jgi:hypothetical protein
MWFLLQCVVMFLVLAANVHYGWTPNGYLSALIAVGAAYLVTRVLYWVARKGGT